MKMACGCHTDKSGAVFALCAAHAAERRESDRRWLNEATARVKRTAESLRFERSGKHGRKIND